MGKIMDYEHGFFGLWRPGGVCRVRIYADEGRSPVVVLTELPKNRNTSVTNMAELLAAEVAERHPSILRRPAAPDEPPFLTILHHPRTPEELRWGIPPSLCSVTFSSYEPARVHSYAMASHGRRPPRRPRLGKPTFVHLTEEEASSLTGEGP